MIITPLKVWVQNILPVVYDDSLSYLEIVAKINAKTNEIITQTNENTHAIETLADVISQLGDIDELKALLDEVKAVIEDLYSTDAPQMDGTASAGSANHAARSDHVHPSDTSKAPVNHASSTTTYGIGNTSNYGHVKITDDINNTAGGTAIKPSVVKSVNDKLSTIAKDNLLDNGCFVGGGSQQAEFGKLPINQQGQSVYIGAGNLIDRWSFSNANGKLTIPLTQDAITLTASASDEVHGNIFFRQLVKGLPSNTVVTVSALIRGSGAGVLRVDRADYATSQSPVIFNVQSFDNPGSEWTVISGSGTLPDGNGVITLRVNDLTSIDIAAIKCEIGSGQTLAHQEGSAWVLNEIPNYAEELLKCQQYFQTFRTEALRPTYGADCRPVMASTEPTKGTVTIDGTTFYTLRA